jgi:hypothetical protein
MNLRSLGARTGRVGRTVALVGVLAGASVAGIATPALAASSGQWCNTVGMWVNYTISSTNTTIEPHDTPIAYAGIARYTGSGITYYFGPGVQNLPIEHHKSSISASNGTSAGNLFKMQGVRFTLPPSPSYRCR